MARLLLIIIALFLLFFSSKAQGTDELQKLREKTDSEIRLAESLLKETKKKREESVTAVQLLAGDINARNKLIVQLRKEIVALEDDIAEVNSLVNNLNLELQKVKLEYATLMTNAYKQRRNYSVLIFLLSSESFNQAYKRFKYSQMLVRYKTRQAEYIAAYEHVLRSKLAVLNSTRNEKNVLVAEVESALSAVEGKKREQDRMVASLKKREKELKTDIQRKRGEADRLSNEIARLIESERKRSATKGARELSLTPAEKALAADFEKNMGKLPWPTSKGFVTGKFGVHRHPVLANVNVRNDGIYISTAENEEARVVFNGQVTKIFSFTGSNFTVLVRHGNFFTLYNNLIEVYVKEGQGVATKQAIGKIYTDRTKSETVLHFQVWKEKEKSDPEMWLSR